MTKTILTYCSLPTLYTLHSKLPTAVEKRWSQFPNRYKDDNVDFLYEFKWPKVASDTPTTKRRESGDFYDGITFLRPSRLPPSENPKKTRWTDKARELTISHERHNCRWFVSYSTYGSGWYCDWHRIPECEQ
jgi:hypothetical protein